MFKIGTEQGSVEKSYKNLSERDGDALKVFDGGMTKKELYLYELGKILATSFVISNDGDYNEYKLLIKPASFQAFPAVYVEKPSKGQMKKMRKIIKKEMAKEETEGSEVIDVLVDIIVPAAGVRSVANETSLAKEVKGLAVIFRKALADKVSNKKTLFYA